MGLLSSNCIHEYSSNLQQYSLSPFYVVELDSCRRKVKTQRWYCTSVHLHNHNNTWIGSNWDIINLDVCGLQHFLYLLCQPHLLLSLGYQISFPGTEIYRSSPQTHLHHSLSQHSTFIKFNIKSIHQYKLLQTTPVTLAVSITKMLSKLQPSWLSVNFTSLAGSSDSPDIFHSVSCNTARLDCLCISKRLPIYAASWSISPLIFSPISS